MNQECDFFITIAHTYTFMEYQNLLYILAFLMGFAYSIKYGCQAKKSIEHYFSKKKFESQDPKK